jgi:two-component system, chemotaxis family, chemotaxis protein CheY
MNFAGTILIVDDEAHIRKYVSLILKSLGVTSVIEASNGEEAVATFQRERPDMVLLDVNMPLIDGIETLKRLKVVDPDCIVVMLTSLANRSTVEQVLELGAANYIRKDTPREEVTKAIADTIAACFETEPPPDSAP